MMPLWNYFKGSGLVFSMADTSVFVPIQVVGASINSQDVPNWGTPIDATSYNLLNNSNLQSGYYAVLSVAQKGYYVTITEPIKGGFLFKQIEFLIQGSTCYNIVFVDKFIIVSCVSQGTLIFYMIDTTSDLMIPIPIQTSANFNIIPLESTLQVVTLDGQETSLVVSFTYRNPQPTVSVFQFSVNIQDQKRQPIEITNTLQKTLGNSIGFRANSDGSCFNLWDRILHLELDNQIIDYVAGGKRLFFDFGVYEVPTGAGLDYIIALITNNGLQNLYYNATLQKFITGNQISDPPVTLKASGIYSVIVNTEYVIFSTGTQIIVFPSFFNEYPYVIWNTVESQNFIIQFDIRSNIIIAFEKNAYIMSQLNAPMLILNQQNINQQTGSGAVMITAISVTGISCEVIFNYNFLTPDSPAQAQNEAIPNSQYTYSQPAYQPLSPYFYGNNLTFFIKSDPESEYIKVKQAIAFHEFSPDFTQLLFTQIFQNPYSNTSYMEIYQLFNTTSNQVELYIGYGEDGIDQVQAFDGAYGPGAITSATVGPALKGLVNIALLNQNGQIYVYTVQWNTTLPDINQPTTIITVPTGSEFPPTLSFTNIHYLTDFLYIITSNPQSLLVYQSNTNQYLYTFQTVAFAPVAVYSNFISYGNNIFIDNQFELIVAQCILTGCVVSQSIAYSQDNTQQSIGIGLLQDGIYIAITNGDSQMIQFYPRQIIHSTYIFTPIPQTAQIPDFLEIQYPVAASFTSKKFYLAWKNGDFLEIAIFQAAYGINNILQHSKSLERTRGINYITAVTIQSTTPYDIVLANGYYSQNVSPDMNQLKVWHQVYADFQDAMLNSQTTQYNMTYEAFTPLQLDSATLSQEVQIIDQYLNINAINPPGGYENQYLNSFGVIKIQPEQYYKGTVQNYTCYQVGNSQEPIDVVNMITQSDISIRQTIKSASTGYVNGCIQSFYIDNFYLYQYNPQQGLLTYYSVATLPGSCPFIFNTQQYLVILCTSVAGIKAYSYNPNLQLFNFIEYFGPHDQLGLANYVNIENSNMGILAMQVGETPLETTIQMYNVTSTSEGVTFTLLAQTTEYIKYYYDNIYVITNLEQHKRKFDFYGVLLVGNDQTGTPQIIFAYNKAEKDSQYPLNLQQAIIRTQDIPFERGVTFIVPYAGLRLPNSIVLACARQFTGGLFEIDINQLNGQATIEVTKIYTLQILQGLHFIGLQNIGSMLIAEFSDTMGDAMSGVIGVYQDAAYYSKGSTLNFKGYLQTQIFVDSPYFPTDNGTLFYKIANLEYTQVYLLDNIYLAVNITSIDQPILFPQQRMSANLILTAQNPNKLAVQKLRIIFEVLNGQSYQINNKAKWYIIGFGLAIVVTVLGLLCYKSRTNKYDHYDER